MNMLNNIITNIVLLLLFYKTDRKSTDYLHVDDDLFVNVKYQLVENHYLRIFSIT